MASKQGKNGAKRVSANAVRTSDRRAPADALADVDKLTGGLSNAELANESAPEKRDRRRENAEATRAALREAGRQLFGSVGFEATSVGALCTKAGVTTGALYHHYRDKKGLFAAVAEELDAGLVALAGAASAKAVSRGETPWQAFIASVNAFLRAGIDPGGRRIGLTDAPAVLGAAQWAEIRERHGLGAMSASVQGLQQLQILPAGRPERIARVVLGMLYGAIESLPGPDDSDRTAALGEVQALVHRMLDGLRLSSS